MKEQRKNRRITIGVCIFTVVVFCVVGILLVTGNVRVNSDGDSLNIKGSYWRDQSVRYDTIQSVSFTDSFKVGFRTNGLGSFKLQEGHFRNDTLGDYILYSYTKCKSYIVMETTSGFIVINAENRDATEKLYEEIESKLGR